MRVHLPPKKRSGVLSKAAAVFPSFKIALPLYRREARFCRCLYARVAPFEVHDILGEIHREGHTMHRAKGHCLCQVIFL